MSINKIKSEVAPVGGAPSPIEIHTSPTSRKALKKSQELDAASSQPTGNQQEKNVFQPDMDTSIGNVSRGEAIRRRRVLQGEEIMEMLSG